MTLRGKQLGNPYVTPSDQVVAELAERLDVGQRELFEERAGIRQFDGQRLRSEAEALAMLDVLRDSVSAARHL